VRHGKRVWVDVQECVGASLCAQSHVPPRILVPIRRRIENSNALLASSSRLPPACLGSPPEQPAARRRAVLRDFRWGWTCVSGEGRGVPQRCWGDGLRKGDLGRLEGSECTRDYTRAEG
jgi:hypothetical protein